MTFDEWLDWLLTDTVTEKSGTFTRFDLTQAVAAALPAGIDRRRRDDRQSGARLARRRRRSATTGPNARRSTRPGGPSTDDRELLYTSRSLLAIEQRLLDQLAGRAPSRPSACSTASAVEAAIAASTLGRRPGRRRPAADRRRATASP